MYFLRDDAALRVLWVCIPSAQEISFSYLRDSSKKHQIILYL